MGVKKEVKIAVLFELIQDLLLKVKVKSYDPDLGCSNLCNPGCRQAGDSGYVLYILLIA